MSTKALRDELRELARLAVPIAAAQLGLMAMGLVDMAMLGRAGKVQLAGAGIGRSTVIVAQTLGMGVALALEPLAAQALGAGRAADARAALGATLRTLAWLWPAGAAAAAIATLALGPLGVDPVAVPVARRFVLGAAPSMFFFTVALACKTFLQAHGRTRPVVLGVLVANAVNFAACALLVRALGALGSGLAMTISSATLAALFLRACAAVEPRELPSERRPPAARILRLGVPIALSLAVEIGVFAFASVLAGRLGPTVTSAHQVALGLASFTFMGALGVSGATAVRVGRAVGEGAPPRARGMLGIGLGAAVMTCGVLLFAGVPRLLVALFSPERDVIEAGAVLLRIAAVFQLFDGVQCVAGGALRGAGDVKFAFVASACGYWVVGLPIALWLGFARAWGAPGLWWGLTAGLVTVAVALATRFYFLSGKARRPIA